MQNIWLERAKRLLALGSAGLHYGEGVYDRERYQEVSDIAMAMLSDLANVPVEKLAGLVSVAEDGYPTPKIDVRGALIVGEQVLLVKEKCDGRWTLPGGFADVGYSASENVEKEFMEEAGVRVRATTLYALRHKVKHPYDPDVRDFYKLFFLCERLGEELPQPGSETDDAGFFTLDALPPLSSGRVIRTDILEAFDVVREQRRTTGFD